MRRALRWLKQGGAGLVALVGLIIAPGCTIADDVAAPQTAIVAFERGNTGFAKGDMITVTGVRGDRSTIEVGGTYEVEGTWKLQSQPEAVLALWSTGGESDGMTPLRVKRGEGHFAFTVHVLAEGNLHVSFYPADHGESFGGTYFGTGSNVYRGHYVPGPSTQHP